MRRGNSLIYTSKERYNYAREKRWQKARKKLRAISKDCNR
jgi:hypothetical protein